MLHAAKVLSDLASVGNSLEALVATARASTPFGSTSNTGSALCGWTETPAMWRLSIITEEERYA
jgi:hypothetical protein